MFSIKNTFFLLALCGIMITTSAQEEACEKCMKNMAYCIDETRFYLCLEGDKPSMEEQPHVCPADTFCTNSTNICDVENLPSVVKVCSSSKDCNVCSGQFACVSKTQYALCRNGQITATTGSCATGQVCSIDLFKKENKICAPPAVLEFLEHSQTCSNDVATTVPPPTTPNAASLKQQCEAAQPTQTNRFYFIKNKDDTTCRTYIYCEVIDNVMQSVLFTCKTGYYDSDARTCVQTKPTNC